MHLDKVISTNDRIYNCLLANHKKLDRVCLNFGKSGIVVYFVILYNHTKSKKILIELETILNDISDKINNQSISGRNLAQIVEFGKACCYVKKYIDVDMFDSDLFAEIDFAAEQLTNISESLKDFDVVSGLLLPGYYYILQQKLTNYDKTSKLRTLVLWFYQNIKSESNENTSLFWESHALPLGKVYLGLVHGVGSILMFLSKVSKLGIEPEKCNDMMTGGINFLWNQRYNLINNPPFFPIAIGKDNLGLPLEWAYGDLSTLYPILVSSKIVKNKLIYQETIEMLLVLSKLKHDTNIIRDGGISHGAVGTAYIFLKCYELTNNIEFLEAYKYWNSESLAFLPKKAPILNYNAHFQIYAKPENNLSFISGLAGIGAMYLVSLNRDNDIIEDLIFL
jgi:lantibiotic modifying enzyme